MAKSPVLVIKALLDACNVLALTDSTSEWLLENDPQVYKQLLKAICEGQEYLEESIPKRFAFRCTRDWLYRGKDVPIKERNGRYVETSSPEQALAYMRKRYPEDVLQGYGFTVQQLSIL